MIRRNRVDESHLLEFSINSILYQRALYPSEDFHFVQKYGLSMLVTNDTSLQAFLHTLLSQVKCKEHNDDNFRLDGREGGAEGGDGYPVCWHTGSPRTLDL